MATGPASTEEPEAKRIKLPEQSESQARMAEAILAASATASAKAKSADGGPASATPASAASTEGNADASAAVPRQLRRLFVRREVADPNDEGGGIPFTHMCGRCKWDTLHLVGYKYENGTKVMVKLECANPECGAFWMVP